MAKANWGGGATGALSGAASGAAIGSFVPGIGTAIGAGVGGLVGGLSGMFGGGDTQPKIRKSSVLEGYQQDALKDYFQNGIGSSPLYQQGSSYLQNLLSGSPEAFAAFEAPLQQNFQQNVVPGIAERFAGMGTGAGSLSSSALYNSLAQAGKNLTTDIGGLRAGLQMQALPQALGYAQQPYSNTLAGLGVQSFQPYERPGQPGFGTQLGSGVLSAAGQAIGQKGGEFFGNQLFGGGSHTPYQAQYPLTNQYDALFRTGAIS